jgi:hypothetical protein
MYTVIVAGIAARHFTTIILQLIIYFQLQTAEEMK